jgi:hypothetical protein
MEELFNIYINFSQTKAYVYAILIIISLFSDALVLFVGLNIGGSHTIINPIGLLARVFWAFLGACAGMLVDRTIV